MFKSIDCLPVGKAIADLVAVWQADLDENLTTVSQWQELLNTEERQRSQRFHFERDRLHFTVARGILRQILSKYVGVAPETLEFAYSDRGKPRLITGNDQGKLEFNLSHSQGKALYAIALKRRVGIDLEKIRPMDGLSLAKRFFSQQEYLQLSKYPESQQNQAFLQLWTAKEALIKATGTGLTELKNIEILWKNSTEIYLSKIVGDAVNNWHLEPLELDNWLATVAVENIT